ncbi:CDPK-related protein kinase-like isoform X1 [Daucus carota subsp. sativus]|uniref:CDPK-related protein kinase-like isoform X1 n=1 Tax=Daucus carota subsp. sativus TaxID=79200 RepID=UPI003083BE85
MSQKIHYLLGEFVRTCVRFVDKQIWCVAAGIGLHELHPFVLLCEGGELLDLILSRGRGYAEDDAKTIIVQILGVVAFCHLQGVVHRDLKSENFLFAARDGDAPLKIIDFGLSHFSRPDEHLNDIVGSAYYVAPEVLHRSYSIEADIWSIGVIAYMLLCTICPGNEAGTELLLFNYS